MCLQRFGVWWGAIEEEEESEQGFAMIWMLHHA